MFIPIKNNSEQVEISIDGQPVKCQRGISAAAAMLMVNRGYRTTPVSNSIRAPFCMMGVCFDCLVTVNGMANQQGCLIEVGEGMELQTQQGTKVFFKE